MKTKNKMKTIFLLFMTVCCSTHFPAQADPIAPPALIDPVVNEQGIAATLFTRTQYCAFLNAVAKNGDPHHLYQEYHRAYISCGNTIPPYSYSVIQGADDPITDMDVLMAARVCNWMHNGQLTIDEDGEEAINSTETGAYSIQESVKLRYNIVTLLPGAKWRLPHQSEITQAMVTSDNVLRVLELTDTEYLRQSTLPPTYVLERSYYLSTKLFGSEIDREPASLPLKVAGFRLVKQ